MNKRCNFDINKSQATNQLTLYERHCTTSTQWVKTLLFWLKIWFKANFLLIIIFKMLFQMFFNNL